MQYKNALWDLGCRIFVHHKCTFIHGVRSYKLDHYIWSMAQVLTRNNLLFSVTLHQQLRTILPCKHCWQGRGFNVIHADPAGYQWELVWPKQPFKWTSSLVCFSIYLGMLRWGFKVQVQEKRRWSKRIHEQLHYISMSYVHIITYQRLEFDVDLAISVI